MVRVDWLAVGVGIGACGAFIGLATGCAFALLGYTLPAGVSLLAGAVAGFAALVFAE